MLNSTLQDDSVQQEDYTRIEKLSNIKFLCPISLLKIAASLIMIYYSFQQNLIFTHISNQFMLFQSFFQGFVALLALLWSISEQKFLKLSTDKWYDSNRHKFSRILFIINSVAIPLQIASFIYIYYNKQLASVYIAISHEKSEEQINFQNDYNKYFIYLSIAIGIYLSCLVYSTFVAYIFSNASFTFRIAIYLLGLIICGASLLTIDSALTLQSYANNQLLPSSLQIELVNYLKYSSIFLILLIFVTYIINYNKFRMGYNNITVIYLVLASAIISFNGLILRDTQTMGTTYLKDCKSFLRTIDEDILSQNGCKQKYLQVGSNYISCPRSEQVLIWDQTAQQDKLACLNTDCCKVPQIIYESAYISFGCCGILLALMCLIYAGFCNFLTNKFVGSQFMNSKTELLFLLALILLSLGGGYFIMSRSGQALKYVHSAESLIYNHNQLPLSFSEDYVPQLSWKTQKSCVDINKLMDQQIDIAQLGAHSYSTNSSSNIYRVSLLSYGGVFFFQKNFSSPSLKIYDSRIASQVFQNPSSLENGQFISLEGTEKVINQFFDDQLKYCVNEPSLAQLQVQVTLLDNKSKKQSTTLTKQYINEQQQERQSYQHQLSHKIPLQSQSSNASYVHEDSHRRVLENGGTSSHLEEIQQVIHEQADNLTEFEKSQLWLDKNVYFSSIDVKVIDQKTSFLLTAAITFSVYDQIYKCNELPEQPLFTLPNQVSLFRINNLLVGYYTIVVEAEGYHANCQNVILSEKNTISEYEIPLLKLLSPGEAFVILQWQDSVPKLELYASQEEGNKECVASYLNKACSNITYEKTDVQQMKAIKIDNYKAKQYLFYVKEYIDYDKYTLYNKLEEQQITQLNDIFLNSFAKITYYVGEEKFPALVLELPLQNKKMQRFRKETNLAWLLFCINGNKIRQINLLQQFWIKESPNPYIIKSEGDQYPSVVICSTLQKYYDEMS